MVTKGEIEGIKSAIRVLSFICIIFMATAIITFIIIAPSNKQPASSSLEDVYDALATDGWQKERVCTDVIVKNTSKLVWCRDSVNNKEGMVPRSHHL